VDGIVDALDGLSVGTDEVLILSLDPLAQSSPARATTPRSPGWRGVHGRPERSRLNFN
jgi:hypothetical protein